MLRESYRSSHEKNGLSLVLDDVEFAVPDKAPNGDLKEVPIYGSGGWKRSALYLRDTYLRVNVHRND